MHVRFRPKAVKQEDVPQSPLSATSGAMTPMYKFLFPDLFSGLHVERDDVTIKRLADGALDDRRCDLRVNEYTGLDQPSQHYHHCRQTQNCYCERIFSRRSASVIKTQSSFSVIQLVRSSLAKGFDFFSSVETRLRNSFMTL